MILQQLHGNGILLGAFLEAGDFIFAGIEQANRITDIRHADADIGGALPVNFHLKFGRVQVQARD